MAQTRLLIIGQNTKRTTQRSSTVIGRGIERGDSIDGTRARVVCKHVDTVRTTPFLSTQRARELQVVGAIAMIHHAGQERASVLTQHGRTQRTAVDRVTQTDVS